MRPLPARDPAGPRPATPRVLLVEDEPTIAVTLRDDLEDHGYAVTHTADGNEALELIAAHGFEAVITDIRLPGADGLAVLRAAGRLRPGPGVLVITGHAAACREAVRSLGSTVLEKPFRNTRVIEWLREIGTAP